jgi:sugar/nucleoside kinase (ribokinase family)
MELNAIGMRGGLMSIYDILVIGRLTSCDIIFAGLQQMPKPGQEEYCKDFFIKPGSSANVAIALAKLGVKVGFLTEIGKDRLGNLIYDYIIQAGISGKTILRPDGLRTCVSAVLSTGTERGFATFYDSSNSVLSDEKIAENIKTAPYLYTDIVHCMESKVSEIAWENNCKLIVDSAWNTEMKLDSIKDILRRTEIFSANEVEAAIITGEDDPVKALSKISCHAKNTVIKLGAKGCIASNEGRFIKLEALSKFEPVDTTGAGDLFGAGMVYGYLKGWDFEKCLKLANVAGGIAVTFYGGIDDAFNYENVMSYFEE